MTATARQRDIQTANPPQIDADNACGARPCRVILPKKGRLAALFNDVMEKGGYSVQRSSARCDYGILGHARETLPAPCEALYMRPQDGLRVMAAGAADMAVAGLDMLREFNAGGGGLDDVTVTPLGLMPCALYIAARNDENYSEPQQLSGKRIATSFPALTRQWLADNNVTGCTVIEYDGGIEDLIRLGVADVICDLVETGKTLAANGLRAQIKVMDSEIALISRGSGAATAYMAQSLQRAVRRPEAVPA